VDSFEWGSSGKKYGWHFRVRAGKRTIAYMIPQHGSFLVGIVLGGKTMNVVRETILSAPVMKIILAAKRYAEGTGFRHSVNTPSDLNDIKLLIEIKVAH
jgi:hypothetical protein